MKRVLINAAIGAFCGLAFAVGVLQLNPSSPPQFWQVFAVGFVVIGALIGACTPDEAKGKR